MNEHTSPDQMISAHSFPVKVRNWARYANRCDSRVISCLEDLFGVQLDPESSAVIELSRQDVFDAFGDDIAKGIITTLVWGYPKGKLPGGRGFERVLDRLPEISAIIAELRAEPPLAAATICSRFEQFSGLGPSTFTKFLYFSGIQAEEGRCLIYDQMVMRAIVVSDLSSWREIGSRLGSVHRPSGGYRMFTQKQQISSYGAYLRIAEQVAGSPMLADLVELQLFNCAPKGRR